MKTRLSRKTRSFIATGLSTAAVSTAMGWALTWAPYAVAHAHPQTQTPAAGATVGTNVHEVVIEFDDGLEPAFSTIDVTDAQNRPVTTAKAAVSPSDNKHLAVPVRPLPVGTYNVAWVAVATDGHRTQGHYAFSVKE